MKIATEPKRLRAGKGVDDARRLDHTVPNEEVSKELCNIPDTPDTNQSMSHTRRVKANLTPAPIRNVPAQRSIHCPYRRCLIR